MQDPKTSFTSQIVRPNQPMLLDIPMIKVPITITDIKAFLRIEHKLSKCRYILNAPAHKFYKVH